MGKENFQLMAAQRACGLNTQRRRESPRPGFPPNAGYLLDHHPVLVTSQGNVRNPTQFQEMKPNNNWVSCDPGDVAWRTAL